ncbi:putative ABC transport system permease protein [Rhizobiales bacterium GAS188]|nr:putative ABC transport system permease protein [Rhizobiales bacterium GAS188]
MILAWTRGVLAHRLPRLVLAASGIAIATALIGAIGIFASMSAKTMTSRALAGVPVDWQIALRAGTDAAGLLPMLSASAPTRSAEIVGYADVAGLEAMTGGTAQTTGAGEVLGIGPGYAEAFPGQIRLLLGSITGVLVAQQTAANLHAGIGDSVTIMRDDGRRDEVRVDGIVDLPNADAMFQTIGPQKGPGPTAPPDNVILLPAGTWAKLFGEAAQKPGTGARYEIHATLDHARLPATPEAAYLDATGRAKNFEVRAAGAAEIGDNLAARLSAARQDALYAQILLFFLGLPGIVLAVLLSFAVVQSGAERRRREQALLSLRGADSGRILRLALAEGGSVALIGALGGTLMAALLGTFILGADLQSSIVLAWLGGTFASGIALALAAVVAPALLDLREGSVASRRAQLPVPSTPLWRRGYVDVVLLILSAIAFWRSASTGYQVVLAPEGVAATSVDATAFLAPLLFWIGAGLLALRVGRAAVAAGRSVLVRALRPLAGRLADPVAASLSRQNVRIASGAALAALAISFATATAIFNTTYNAQLLVDAQLTNGADVTVTGTAASPAGDRLGDIAALAGVAAAEPMQHRYAYVGNDLQDLYGIDPARIERATPIADAYFADRDARATLARLAATPDGVLVSQETVNDFQLGLGDLLNLRLQNTEHRYVTVPFHFVGVVTEFPTAPRDSFLVANASYVAARSGDPHAEIVLVRSSDNPESVAASIRAAFGPASPLRITDLAHAARLIGSSLTAVDLRALTSIELAFAVLLAGGATGLVLALGFAERRRVTAILAALGAQAHEVRAFLWGEALIILIAGLALGSVIGAAVAVMLVKLLSGVFDPPPDALSVPWAYLALVATGATLATVLAVWRSSEASLTMAR